MHLTRRDVVTVGAAVLLLAVSVRAWLWVGVDTERAGLLQGWATIPAICMGLLVPLLGWWWAGRRSGAVHRSGHGERGVGSELGLVLATGAKALQVHPAIEDGAGSDAPFLTPYAARAHDDQLRELVEAAAAGSSGLAVLVGTSSTGKTRACWEAVGHLELVAPGQWRLWRPSLHDLVTRLEQPDTDLRRTVLWLAKLG